MVAEAGAFDGWGSSLIGGVVGATVAVIAVFLTQHLVDRRKRGDDRNTAKHQLMIEVSNLRDAAAMSRETSLTGRYDMWPLRNQLLVTYSTLGRYPSFNCVEEFYESVRRLRSWVRRNQPDDGVWPPDLREVVEQHRQAQYEYSQHVIDVLKDHAEDPASAFKMPDPPAWPPELREIKGFNGPSKQPDNASRRARSVDR